MPPRPFMIDIGHRGGMLPEPHRPRRGLVESVQTVTVGQKHPIADP